ncbi:hypothetical protein E1264_17850 [Actinomadura sp. KC216]|uniref:hypothetical protein n=1 Tax=Actinomadura sp. KC216 TaxID=2530370 RepID=UPI00104FACF2|nr:hypothetical protein [Actinomadura sp. KC216]TDB86462.1 hypothetical protein E1264_17850 [Actinomadura sp. KC216]
MTSQVQPCGSRAAYQREYRKRMPLQVRVRHALREEARRAALVRLAEEQPDLMDELMAELMADGGKQWQVRIAARHRLAHECPEQFARLYAKEKAQRGLT